MEEFMKSAIRVFALAAGLALPLAAFAQQQPWPNRVVHIVSTSPPGGSVDLFARIAAEEFTDTFGQTFVVENRPGANGNIGVDLVMRAPADGHMLFVSPAGPFSINASIMKSMSFNPQTDIAPIAMLGVSPLLLVVPPSGPAAGTPTDLLAGRVTMSFVNTSTTIRHIQDGKLRAIAVAERKRIAAAPEVPTVAESGGPGFEATSWFGLATRPGTARGIIDR